MSSLTHSEKIIKRLGSFWQRKDVPLISREDLFEIRNNVKNFLDPIPLGDGVEGFVIPVYLDKTLMFRTVGIAGSILELHAHNCKEIVRLIEGQIKLNEVLYNPGDTIVFQPNIAHKLEGVTDYDFYVEFPE